MPLRPARRRNEVFTRFFYKKIAGVQRAGPFGRESRGRSPLAPPAEGNAKNASFRSDLEKMARKKKAEKEAPKSIFENKEFFLALDQLEKVKGIPVDYMLDRVGQALITAYKRENDGMTDNIYVIPDREQNTIRMFVRKTVVDDVYEPYEELSLEEAREYKPGAMLGDIIDIDVPTRSFSRIAAQTAKQVIIQGIREAERGMVLSEFESKEHEILTALVSRIDPRSGSIILEMVSQGEKTEAVLTPSEQVAGERYEEGDHVKVYVIEVRKGTRGPQVMISRTHPGLVKRLFELEVPEIHDGTVEVKSIAREAGNRTKIAVCSTDANVDPIGACVGTRGARVGNIVNELGGEKIDIIKWSEDTAAFVSAALAPADVVSATVLPDGKSCRVIVPDDQLSLAIGKEGQNARLAAKLTGCKIDIAPASQADSLPPIPEPEPEPEPEEMLEDGAEAAELTEAAEVAETVPDTDEALPEATGTAEPEEAAQSDDEDAAQAPSETD